ncbi:MAG: hypothetical protein JNM88_10850 [Chitinophagaceae bacterium]|nr:hypothetical protein [Chitinophagaceae bacterium]
MKAYFEILFQVNVFHRFYPDEDDNRCKALSFEPTNDCSRLLREHKLYFKQTDNGFIIAAEKKMTGGTEAAPLLEPVAEIEPGTCFNFFIKTNRLDFLNITDADLTQFAGGKKFYLRNNVNSPLTTNNVVQTPDMNNFWLTVNSIVTTVTVHDLAPLTDTLKIGTVNFAAPVNIPDDPAKLVLRDADGNTVLRKTVPRNSLNEITTGSLLLADSPLPENIYHLEQVDSTNTVLSEETWFLTEQAGSSGIEGILQLQYNHALKNTGATEYQFEIDLDARAVQWSYRIQVDEYEDPLDAVNNYNPDDLRLNTLLNNVPVLSTSFTQAKDTGPPVLVRFDSVGLIPLREEAYKGVNLVDKDALAVPIIANMPNANPSMLRDAGGGNYRSEIFLKIK